MKTFIVIRAQLVGNPETGYVEAFSTSGESYAKASTAFTAGYRALGHDDFLVGRLEDGRLDGFVGLVDEPERVAAAAKELCLTGARPIDESKYKIASTIRPDHLEELVRELMRDGWVPQGGVSYSSGSYLQAMVRMPAIKTRGSVVNNVHTRSSDDA